MESGCPPPALWNTEGVTRSLGIGSISFPRCSVPGTCLVWLRIWFSKDQVRRRGQRQRSEALEDADRPPAPSPSVHTAYPRPPLVPYNSGPRWCVWSRESVCTEGLWGGEWDFRRGWCRGSQGFGVTAVRKSSCLLTQEGSQATK